MSSAILTTLHTDPTSWLRLVSFSPMSETDPSSDANLRNRYLTLLALHAQPKAAEDMELVTYLLDEEIRYHQKADHYRSSLSLACYLLACYKQPRHLWVIWAARESNYDASKSVDSHYLYYSAGSMAQAQDYVEGCSVSDIPTSSRGLSGWWNQLIEEAGANEENAFAKLKLDVLKRIEHDRKYGVTDEKVAQFVESSWQSETGQWGESLLPEEY